jgi:hydrogenase maturation factor
LDVCCWNRPFDDQRQVRIHLESEAVLAIVSEIERGRWVLVTSEAIDEEIDETADRQRLERVRNSIPRKR